MNEEIKEILDEWKKFLSWCYENNDKTIEIHRDKAEKIIDYITNLQQKIEQYENPDDMTLFYMWLDVKAKDKMKELEEENERLKIQVSAREELYEYSQLKIDKAIEFIKERQETTDIDEVINTDALLNILQNRSDSQ